MDRNTTFEKMRMESADMIGKNVEKIAELFPECVTEAADQDGKIRRLVDFEKLREILSGDVAEEPERYDFTWVGKSAALAEAHTPIRKTLRPCPKESRDWDTTQNLYIEGDNLDVLKLLQESYLGQIKMIYIDPPYNTGNDFIYRDDFKLGNDKYEENLGIYDEEDKRLVKNTDSNGRFHSDWCSMLYARLVLTRNILKDDGVLFVSIDEHELDNCLKILDDVFGRTNRVGVIVVKSNPRGSMAIGEIANLHEYLVVYSKDSLKADIIGHRLSDAMENEYKYEDQEGKYRLLGLRMRGGFWRRSERPKLYFPIFVNPQDCSISLEKDSNYTEEAVPIQPSSMEDGTWRWSSEKVLTDKKYLIGKKVKRGGSEVWDIYQKDYYDRDGGRRTKAKSIWDDSEVNYQNGASEIKELFGKNVFDYSKPVFLLNEIIEMIGMKDGDIVMDFFSGSATTAHAVILANAHDGCKRNFIMVQLQEICGEESVASASGYTNICEIGKERIRRAGDKITAENPLIVSKLDVGFRVLKVDSTNMNDVYYSASEVSQDLIKSAESNIKDDRTELDLLFGCLLDWGVPLSYPYNSEEIDGATVHDYNDGDLIACFAENISEKVVKEIARRKPTRAVFRDSCFASDAAKINVTELFKRYSPDTRIKTI